MTEDADLPATGQLYRHVNGNTYIVVCVSEDDYLGIDLVIHKGTHDGHIWARPVSNFLGLHNTGVPRFVRVYSL